MSKNKITIYLPTYLVEKVKGEAGEEHRSMTAQIEHILSNHYYRASPYFVSGGYRTKPSAEYDKFFAENKE